MIAFASMVSIYRETRGCCRAREIRSVEENFEACNIRKEGEEIRNERKNKL